MGVQLIPTRSVCKKMRKVNFADCVAHILVIVATNGLLRARVSAKSQDVDRSATKTNLAGNLSKDTQETEDALELVRLNSLSAGGFFRKG